MPRVDGLTRCEDDEAEWYFLAAKDLTTVQLRLAGEIVAAAAPGTAATPEMLIGVLQAFATNFSAIAISRRLPQEDD